MNTFFVGGCLQATLVRGRTQSTRFAYGACNPAPDTFRHSRAGGSPLHLVRTRTASEQVHAIANRVLNLLCNPSRSISQ